MINDSNKDQFLLSNSLKDGISSVSFSPFDPNTLMATSWSKEVVVYSDVKSKNLEEYSTKSKIYEGSSGFLDGCWIKSDLICGGGLDGRVSLYGEKL